MADIPVRLFIERGGKVMPFDGFTEEERAAISKRLSKTVSDYCFLHPEEFDKIPERRTNEKEKV